MNEQWQNEEKKGKSREEKWQPDRWDAVGWAFAFFWGALVLLAGTTEFSTPYSWWDGWGIFFTGAGVITLIETVFRLLTPEYRYKWVGSLIFGLILLAIGLGTWEVWGWLWVVVLSAIGVIILREVLVRKR